MAFVLLNEVAVVGESPSQKFTRLVRDHTVQVNLTGSPTAVIVSLLGSLNDSTFFELARHTFSAAEIASQAAMFHVTDKAVRYVKISLVTLTGGTAPTVTAYYEGFESRS